jgi:predicted transposase YdaD
VVPPAEEGQFGRRQQYDSTTKLLVAADPPAWLALAGLPGDGPVRSVDVSLDTIRAQADAVLRVGRRAPWYLHVELQTSRDRKLPERVHRYNVLLYERERRPIVSLVVLLRPRADGPELRGEIERHEPGGEPYEWFRYRVVRAWQLPTEALLTGPLGTLPLSPLPEMFAPGQREAVRRERVRAVVEQIDRRLRAEASGGRADELRVATHYLLGLRYSEAISEQLTRGIWGMWDSKTYRYAVETGIRQGEARGEARGRVDEARRFLARFAERALGPAPASAQAALAAIDDVDTLERLADRLPDVRSWDELLAT